MQLFEREDKQPQLDKSKQDRQDIQDKIEAI